MQAAYLAEGTARGRSQFHEPGPAGRPGGARRTSGERQRLGAVDEKGKVPAAGGSPCLGSAQSGGGWAGAGGVSEAKQAMIAGYLGQGLGFLGGDSSGSSSTGPSWGTDSPSPSSSSTG